MGQITKKQPQINREPLVSIIVTTKNEEDVIRRLLTSIQKQYYSNIEIIIVDNNSQDGTQKISQLFTKKVYNFGPERSAQRNFGAKKSQGKYLLFLDADMRVTKLLIKECVGLIESDRLIGGVVIPERSNANNYWGKVKAFERSFYNDQGDDSIDAARFFPKTIFKKIGGYDEEITGPEDWDITDRIRQRGYKIKRITSIIHHQERIYSLLSLAKKKYYYALTLHNFLNKHHKHIINSRTVYFLRPVFYKNHKKLFSHPILTLGMLVALSAELLSGTAGYIMGRIRQ